MDAHRQNERILKRLPLNTEVEKGRHLQYLPPDRRNLKLGEGDHEHGIHHNQRLLNIRMITTDGTP